MVFTFFDIAHRNTTQSHGWAYQDKPLVDKHINGFHTRHGNNYNDNHRYNSQRNHQDVSNPINQLSGDHRIRITVNCDTEPCTLSDRNQNTNDESESGASITIVEIDDSQHHLIVDTKPPPPPPQTIRNTLNGTSSSKQINTFEKRYNEKAVDVPEDFERKAYEFQRNELSPFVRNLQPNSQVIVRLISVFFVCVLYILHVNHVCNWLILLRNFRFIFFSQIEDIVKKIVTYLIFVYLIYFFNH